MYWGFDQLTDFTSSTLSSTESTDGTPSFIGRYITYGNAGDELGSSEASLIHGQGIPILLIADATSNVGSPSEANMDANGAVAAAKALGADPNSGITIYRDIEESDSVTTSYINQWYSDIEGDGYIPGLYEDSYAGAFEAQFCASSSTTRTGTVLWSSEIHQGSSLKKVNAPTTFNPQYGSCEAFGNISTWQYLTGSPDVDEGALGGLWS